jgi:membrane protein implicated in regulation of membrane protease activity
MRGNQLTPVLVAVAFGAIAVALLLGEGASLPLAIVLVFPLVLVVTVDGVRGGGRRGAPAHDQAREDEPVGGGAAGTP